MSDHTPTPFGRINPIDAQHDAIRGIAAAVVQARANTNTMGRFRRQEDAVEFLLAVETQLAALIAVGAVPPPPDPRRQRLT